MQTEENKAAELHFESFDGGGPSFEVLIADAGIVRCSRSVHYSKPDHEEMTGAGYTVTLRFTGLAPGETELTVQARSPIAENSDMRYLARVDSALNVELEFLDERDPFAPCEG